MVIDVLIAYARRIRELRRAHPDVSEPALAPAFQDLIGALFPALRAHGLIVVPEFARAGLGRPDIALVRAGQPARAFIELKAPNKSADPSRWRDVHDRKQFERFRSLRQWAVSNFSELIVFERDVVAKQVVVVPSAALSPTTTDGRAERLIRDIDPDVLLDALRLLTADSAAPASTPKDVAANLAHTSRLVRSIIAHRLEDIAAGTVTDAPLIAVREEFRNVLYSRPQAAGYNVSRFDPLFAAAFAQTLAFGLLLVREATGREVDRRAWEHMPPQHALMRATLRVLSQEEIVETVGIGVDVMIDTINGFDLAILAAAPGERDPILYFYEDFLEVFDPEEREKFGVYFTPVEVVTYIVAAMDRALREGLGTDGLSDPDVTILDPATGTGTFLLGVVEHVRRSSEPNGPGFAAAAMAELAGRLFGFELLIGPYAVAQYRLRHALGAVQRDRMGVFLSDTLAEPGAAAALGRLGFIAEGISEERRASDDVKSRQPILAILGNPPYRRLREGETAELVGSWMNALWDDLKAPVRDAGWGNQLNTFPEMSVAFWRWALWKLFESDGAPRRGVVAMITNRKFLTGKPYAGLRRMMRERFDHIEIIDLRGDVRLGERAGVVGDEGVFNIQVGTAITIAWASGAPRTGPARVTYADAWERGLSTRASKLEWLRTRSDRGAKTQGAEVRRDPLHDFRPEPFAQRGMTSLVDCFVLNCSGMETKRDHVVYGFSIQQIRTKINNISLLSEDQRKLQFNSTAKNSANRALNTILSENHFIISSYRPLDNRLALRHPFFVDRLRPKLMQAWGERNCSLFSLPGGIGRGPAVWCCGSYPDRHAFRGSYGGYAFPRWDRARGPDASNLSASLIAGLEAAYGGPVADDDVFDAILALLSAESYSLIFAEDLEDTFPHVPFPVRREVFDRAAIIGRDIRAIETFARAPGAAFLTDSVARIETTPTGPVASTDLANGAIVLCADGSGRVTGLDEEAWSFAVSGYRVIPRWLEARVGQPTDRAFLLALRDLVGRVRELIHLFHAADAVLTDAMAHTLTRDMLELPANRAVVSDAETA